MDGETSQEQLVLGREEEKVGEEEGGSRLWHREKLNSNAIAIEVSTDPQGALGLA